MVHLTEDLKPATHQLIANEFLPDLPDNPYKTGWREEFYSTADWASLEKVPRFFFFFGKSCFSKFRCWALDIVWLLWTHQPEICWGFPS